MKHSLYFLIIITLLFAGCRQKAQSNFLSESSAQTEESNPHWKSMLKKQSSQAKY